MTIYPNLEAVLITGITPQEARAKGENEATFARRIHSLFTVPKTCILGYNNQCVSTTKSHATFFIVISTILTHRSWQHDNSRWDLLDVMRACYALRPEGINWPQENDDGLPSFSP
ncbi:hypothetical protein MJ391_18860 [Escherichia coli]|nr:hypothetical protein MJ391_18860 [Escherichia coli]